MLASKNKINTRLAFVNYPNGNKMDQMVRNDNALYVCNCKPLLELLFGTQTFHFNCFLEDFNCLFTQIRCLSRVLYPVMKIIGYILRYLFILIYTYLHKYSSKRHLKPPRQQVPSVCSQISDLSSCEDCWIHNQIPTKLENKKTMFAFRYHCTKNL